jgi:hypothetical protein
VAPIGLGELITSWGEPFRCLACSTERLRRRIYLLRRANLTMSGVRAGVSAARVPFDCLQLITKSPFAGG